MTATLLLALMLGCSQEKAPPSGVFVGNPGKLELTAARSEAYALEGTVQLDELLLGACGTTESVSSPLEGRELRLVDDGLLRFELDEPLQVPPGAWCRLELVLGLTDLTASGAGADGLEQAFTLRFEGVSIGVSGPEFVIDDQLLALELAERDWLEPLAGIVADDPDAGIVDLLEVAPGVHADLQAALEQRSALFLTDVGEGADANTDLPPEAEEGAAPVWAGDGREPTPTEPTDPPDTGVEPTDTGIVEPDPVDLQVEPLYTLQPEVLTVGVPLYAMGMLLIPAVGPEGSVLFFGPDYLYDPAAGQPIQLEATEAALATDDQQLYLMSTTPLGAAIDAGSIDSFDPNQTTPYPGTASRPVAGRLAAGPVFTWLDAGQLRFVYATEGPPALLADGVVDHDLGTDGSDGMLVSWVEAVGNPLSDGATAQFTAYLAEDRTVLFDGTPSGDALHAPRVALADDRAIVGRLEGDDLVIQAYGIDGLPTVPLQVDAGSATAFDLALVGDVAIVAWGGPDGLQIQLLDVVSGLPITEPTPAGDGAADQITVAAVDEGILRFAIATTGDFEASVLEGISEDALLR